MSKKVMHCRLKNLMDEHEVNIAQLARLIDISENTIRGYVKNSFSRIDCEVAIKLCSHFGVEMGEMFVIQTVGE